MEADKIRQKRDVGRTVNVLNNLIKRDIESHNQDESVTGMQGVILYFILKKQTDVYSKDIEEEFCMRRATVSGYLALLEKNGMIVREDVAEDRRLKKINLTVKAHKLLSNIEENIRRNEMKLAAGLSKEEIDEFLRISAIMTNNLTD